MPTAPGDNDTSLLKHILNRKIEIYVKRDGILGEEIVLTDHGQYRYKTRRAYPLHGSLKGTLLT